MAKLNFRDKAIKSTTLAQIMDGRDKIDTEDIIKNFPEGFTIDEIEYVTMQKGEDIDQFWAYHIKGTDYFAFGGYILNKIFNDYLVGYEGTYDELYREFKESGGIRVKLTEGKTKDGKSVTLVKVL